ncbi:MAG: glycosyltransferase family 4 protein [Candidatus Aenigmatarchaeota archaeon]
MKIAFVCRYFKPSKGGVSRSVNELAEYLTKGHEVHFVTTNHEDAEEPEDEDIDMHRLDYRVLFNEPVFSIKDELEKIEPDTVHLRYPSPWGYLQCLKYKKNSNAKLVITYGAKASSSWYVKLLAWFFNRLIFYPRIDNVNRLVYTNPYVGPSLENSEVIRNGVDTDLFNKKDINKDIDVLFVGRLTELKRVDWILEALEGTDLKTVIVGSGPKKEELEKLAEEKNVNAKFEGWVKNEKLPEYYNRTKVTAIPSRMEGLPIVAIESRACGTPVVGTDVGGMKDAVDENRLCKDFNEFRKKLIQTVEENPTVELPNKFDKQKGFERYEEIYREIMD